MLAQGQRNGLGYKGNKDVICGELKVTVLNIGYLILKG